MTVHKTQGMTLDSMVLHVGSAFECAQVYVGLSRARSLAHLEVREFRPNLVKAHPKALAFYAAAAAADSSSSTCCAQLRSCCAAAAAPPRPLLLCCCC